MDEKEKTYVNIIREFNRCYTNILGLLDQRFLDSKLSLSEARILYEIHGFGACTANCLAKLLCMDAGYLSRILKRFQEAGLSEKKQSPEDKRTYRIFLTEKGERLIKMLNDRSAEQIYDMIRALSDTERSKLVQSMESVETILTQRKNIKLDDITIRHDLRAGDAGYITCMHGRVYQREYGYSATFEAYVAQSFYEFLMHYNAEQDRLWVAEHHDTVIGCIGVAHHDSRAQLRWFLLDPDYRGVGLGQKLLNTALDFCRRAGYKSAYLDTTDDLKQAVHMYEKAGFVRVSEKENHAWKDDIMELEYAMDL